MAESRPPVALIITMGFNVYHQQLVRGIRPVLAPHGLILVVNSQNFTSAGLMASVEHLIRTIRPYGAIVTPSASAEEDAELAALLGELSIPTVGISMQLPGASQVHADDRSGMRALMAHLLDECGVRRLAHARGQAHQADSIAREQVFREELAARGIPVDEDLIFDGAFWHEETYRELRALLSRRRGIEAVVAANDMSALGALKALADEGLRVPEDVLVTGFDNYPSSLCWPALTSVDPEQAMQGRVAAERLLAELNGAPAGEEIVVPTRLVVRGSTRSLPFSAPEQIMAVVDLANLAQEELAARDALWGLTYVLSRCATPEDLADGLAGSALSRLGIGRCFLAVYAEVPESGEPEARLLLDYQDGVQGPPCQEVYPLAQLLPSTLHQQLRTELLVFQPLYGNDRELGYLLFEQRSGSMLVTAWLRTELSLVLEAMFSTQALKDHAATLEQVVAHRTAELSARSAELTARSEQLEAEVETRRRTEIQLQQAVAALHRTAMSDSLTQLANRTHLQEHLDAQWQALAGHGGELALLMIDVDLFKAYNDCYGHLKGDEALRTVATHLAEAVRYPRDLACRYGGEEFVLALPDTDRSAALVVAERFRAALATAGIPHKGSTIAPVMTVSIGLAVARPQDVADPWALLDHADRALYRAKTQGRDQVWSLMPGTDARYESGGPGVPHPRSPLPVTDPARR